MKKLIPVFIALVATGFVNSALANDQDNLNNALKKGEDVYCNNIKNSDLKNYCQGLVKKQDVYCNSIKDRQLKKECKAKAK